MLKFGKLVLASLLVFLLIDWYMSVGNVVLVCLIFGGPETPASVIINY